MYTKRPCTLVDLLDDIEARHRIAGLVIEHDGINEIYDSEDIEFIDPNLFERFVESYEITDAKRRRVGVTIVLKED